MVYFYNGLFVSIATQTLVIPIYNCDSLIYTRWYNHCGLIFHSEPLDFPAVRSPLKYFWFVYLDSRRLKDQRSKFHQQPMSTCYGGGIMVDNNNNNLPTRAALVKIPFLSTRLSSTSFNLHRGRR